MGKSIAHAEEVYLKSQASFTKGAAQVKNKVFDKAVQAKNAISQQLSSSSHAQPGSILVPQKSAAQALLSAQEIAELEGVLGRNTLPASSCMHKGHLENHLIAEEIANGHAFEKHVINQNEFPGWTRQQYQQHIENILHDQPAQWQQQICMHETININSVTGKTIKEIKEVTCYVDNIEKPTRWYKTSGEKKMFYQESSQTLIIYNPNDVDGGTAYRPTEGFRDFLKQD